MDSGKEKTNKKAGLRSPLKPAFCYFIVIFICKADISIPLDFQVNARSINYLAVACPRVACIFCSCFVPFSA